MHNYHRKKESKQEVRRRQEQQQQQHIKQQTVAKTATTAPASARRSSPHPVLGRDLLWSADEEEGCGYKLLEEQLASVSRRGSETSAEEGEESNEKMPQEKLLRFQYKDWQPHVVKESTNGSLYLVKAVSSTGAAGRSCGEVRTGVDSSTGMVTIQLRGQGFLMNQIRLMISAAVLYARGIIPLSVIHLSLDTPYRFSFPLAPAEGLLLVDSGYARNVSGQSYTLHPHHKELELSNEVAGERARDGEREGEGGSTVLSLMTAGEYATSEQFKESFIYPEVHQDWNGSDADELSKR